MEVHRLKRETEKVIKKIVRFMERYETIGKKEFEAILDQVIAHLHKNTGLDPEVIARHTRTVIQDLPNEYGHLSEEVRSWEAIIGYLYLKYLRELGILER